MIKIDNRITGEWTVVPAPCTVRELRQRLEAVYPNLGAYTMSYMHEKTPFRVFEFNESWVDQQLQTDATLAICAAEKKEDNAVDFWKNIATRANALRDTAPLLPNSLKIIQATISTIVSEGRQASPEEEEAVVVALRPLLDFNSAEGLKLVLQVMLRYYYISSGEIRAFDAALKDIEVE